MYSGGGGGDNDRAGDIGVPGKSTSSSSADLDSKPDHNRGPKKSDREPLSESECEPKPGPGPSSAGVGGNIGIGGGDQAPGQVLALPAGGASVKALRTVMNELIFGKIAKNLPVGNLFSLRQTCSTWNREFLPLHAAQHKPIDLHTDPKDQCRDGGPPCSRLMSEFTNAMQSSSPPLPFGGFSINDLGMGFEAESTQRDVQRFFSMFGTTITRLDLKLKSAKSIVAETLRQIVFEWTPELRELTIFTHVVERATATATAATSSDTSDSVSPKNEIQAPKKEIPKLRRLTLRVGLFSGADRPYFGLCEGILQYAVGLESLSLDESQSGRFLQTVGESPALHRLKCLKVSRLEAEPLRLLTELGSRPRDKNPLRLLELAMSVDRTKGTTDAEMAALVHAFLVTQAETLCSLDIKIGNIRSCKPRLPRMENLKSMTLQRDENWNFPVQCCENDDATFASNFPGLKRLEFIFDPVRTNSDLPAPWDPYKQPTSSPFAHEGVTSLKIEMERHDQYLHWADPYSDIPHSWPSISKLDLTIPGDIFQQLSKFWNTWPGLISLRVLIERFGWMPFRVTTLELDELLSGIPASKSFGIRLQLASRPRTLRALQSRYKQYKGISDLEQLQEFVLDAGQHPFTITDIGGYLGLAMMPSPAIQHVALIHRNLDQDFCVKGRRKECAGNQISGECRSFMRTTFGPFAVLDL